MPATERIEPYDKRYNVRGFDCGQPSLDRWLIQYAGQGERRNTARTYLAVDDREPGPYTTDHAAEFARDVLLPIHQFVCHVGLTDRALCAVFKVPVEDKGSL